MSSGAALGVGGALGGLFQGIFGSQASGEAANAQIEASKQASAIQLLMYARTRADLAQYRQAGDKGIGTLMGSMSDLTKPFDPTQAQLEQTPGYQFTLNQGEKALQNSYAAQGLGSSGAAMKGATQFGEGLASTTFQQQMQNYMAQNMQKYNMLMGVSQLGEGAAAGTAQAGQFTGSQVAGNLIGGGNAAAAGILGGYNSWQGGLNNAMSGAFQGMLFNKLYPGG